VSRNIIVSISASLSASWFVGELSINLKAPDLW